jgi:hypothetical protein
MSAIALKIQNYSAKYLVILSLSALFIAGASALMFDRRALRPGDVIGGIETDTDDVVAVAYGNPPAPCTCSLIGNQCKYTANCPTNGKKAGALCP